MAKKFGTGKISDAASGARKWASSAASQVQSAQQQSIETRYITLEQASLDPQNPRRLDVSPALILSILQTNPLPNHWLESSNDSWIGDYLQSISALLPTPKAQSEFQDLLLLALSIKQPERLMNPITVYKTPEQRYQVIAGERRYLAHMLLGASNIAARILDDVPTALELTILQWEENNQRADLTLLDKIGNVASVVKLIESAQNKPLTVSGLMRACGLPRASAHRYLTVIRFAHKDLLAQLIEAQNINSLRLISDLCKLNEAALKQKLQPNAKAVKASKPAASFAKHTKPHALLTVLTAAAQALDAKDVLSALQASDAKKMDIKELGVLFNTLIDNIESDA